MTDPIDQDDKPSIPPPASSHNTPDNSHTTPSSTILDEEAAYEPTSTTDDGNGNGNGIGRNEKHPASEKAMAKKTKANSIGERPACFRNTSQEVAFIFLATIALASSSILTGGTVIITAAIGRDLGMSQSQISWISAAPTLTAGAFQLALGQLSDLIGRKPIFLCGMFSFSIGSLIAGFSQNAFWMNILCGILGISSAALVPPAIGVLGAAYAVPCKRKNWAFACFSSGNPLGYAVGSVASGIAARIFDWRAVFFLMAILFFVFGVAAIWVMPSVEAFEPAPFMTRLKLALRRFDSVGTVLTILGVGMFTAALTLGPADGWKSPLVLCMLIIGFFLLVGFVFWEFYWPEPLMPMHIWKDRTFSLLITICILGMTAFISSNFWLSYSMQKVHNWSALSVALHMLPQVIAGVIWNICAANMLHLVNNGVIMAFGSVAYVVAAVLLSLQDARSLYWAFSFPSLVINVIGADFQFNVVNMYVMQSLPSHQQSSAGGILNMLIRLGSTLGIGVSTAVYSSLQETSAASSNIMLPYQRAFDVSIGLAAAGCLFVPFVRLGTQGNAVAERRQSNADGRDAIVEKGKGEEGEAAAPMGNCDRPWQRKR